MKYNTSLLLHPSLYSSSLPQGFGRVSLPQSKGIGHFIIILLESLITVWPHLRPANTSLKANSPPNSPPPKPKHTTIPPPATQARIRKLSPLPILHHSTLTNSPGATVFAP